jgi:hypothetical protein
MVYGTYNELVYWGESKPTNITMVAPHWFFTPPIFLDDFLSELDINVGRKNPAN